MFRINIYLALLFFTYLFVEMSCKKSNPDEKPAWAKKDIRDFSDADMERLLDQWEVSKRPMY